MSCYNSKMDNYCAAMAGATMLPNDIITIVRSCIEEPIVFSNHFAFAALWYSDDLGLVTVPTLNLSGYRR